MDRLFAVRSIRFRRDESSESRANNLGFSVVRLKRLYAGAATSVRADLKIRDPDALTALAAYYNEDVDLHWTLGIGSSPVTLSVDLQFTRFRPLSGTVQLVRRAVPQDLIGEIEKIAADSDASHERDLPRSSSASPLSSGIFNRSADNRSNCTDQDPEDVTTLWPEIFG